MSGLAAATMSVAMIAVFLLAGGGMVLLVRGQHRKQGALMLVAALVLLGNVLIWTL
jgi:hypothetical protein